MRVLLMDGNPLMWRAFHGRGLNNNNVAHGIVRSFFEIISEVVPTEVVLFWDSGRSRWRRALYPEYKAHRDDRNAEKPDEMKELHRQADLAKRFFRVHNIRQVQSHGVEADDLISWFRDYYVYNLNFQEGVISTSDRDLWQLADNRTWIFDILQRRQIHPLEVQQELGVDPRKIPDLKSMAGDTADNIPGVKGVGEKSAKSLLETLGTLGSVLDLRNMGVLEAKKKTKKILDDAESAETAYQLVKIPSLEEARWYLTPEESLEIKRSVEEQPPLTAMEALLLREDLGTTVGADSSLLPKGSSDLTGLYQQLTPEEPPPSFSSLAEVDQAILGCHRCPLRGCTAQYGPTLPQGYQDVEIMVIGRNPGTQELVEGVPFVGPAGKRVDRFLKEVGLSRRECWITNACKCFSENNRPPTLGEVRACLPYIQAEIALIKPKLILTLGNEAMSLVTPWGSGVTHHCGEILQGSTGLVGAVDSRVAVSVHPSAALRSQKGEAHMQFAESQVADLIKSVTQ